MPTRVPFPNPPVGETQLRDPELQTPHGQFASQVPDLLRQIVELLTVGYGAAAPATLFASPNLRATFEKNLPRLFQAATRARGPIAMKNVPASDRRVSGTARSTDRFGKDVSTWDQLLWGPRPPAGSNIELGPRADTNTVAHEILHGLYSAKGLPASPPSQHIWTLFSHFLKKNPVYRPDPSWTLDEVYRGYLQGSGNNPMTAMRETVIEAMAREVLNAEFRRRGIVAPRIPRNLRPINIKPETR